MVQAGTTLQLERLEDGKLHRGRTITGKVDGFRPMEGRTIISAGGAPMACRGPDLLGLRSRQRSL
jgi:hypothetical protein